MKSNKHEKMNYTPVSVISDMSRILDRCLYDQIIETLAIYFLDVKWAAERDTALNIHWLRYLKKQKKKEECDALFINLSKALVCLKHDLLLAKVNALGFNYKSLKLIPSFLSNWKYRTKTNSSFRAN